MSGEAFIIGSGSYLPAQAVSNDELATRLGIDPERIFKSSGIRSRRWAKPDETTSSLAAGALKAALNDAGTYAHEIDYLLCGTMTPDRFIPGSASAIQKKAGLAEIPCLDIRAACGNGLYSLQLAKALIASGTARNAALCLAEVQSRWLDLTPASATTSMLFGDGGAALIVSGKAKPGAWEILDVLLATDGSFVDDLGVRCPGAEFGTIASDTLEPHSDYLPRMNGQSVILQASRRMIASCRTVLERNQLAATDISWVVAHQANANLLAQVARGLGITREKIVSVLEETGNTSSASMGIALDSLRRSKKVEAGEYLLLPAFAAGFTWGAALCRA
jgi:3-oxoacyl-[acyl-carrier-protein] synthase III